MNPWEWVTSTSSVDSLLTTLGLGVLALLFARDLIITKAQHLRRVQDIVAAHEQRVADLVSFHASVLQDRDDRIAEIREARDAWKEAENVARGLADKAVDGLTEVNSTLVRILHVLESLDRALPNPSGGEHERV